MPKIDECATAVPSRRFERALNEELQWAAKSIISLIVRIACNPYEKQIVRLCQLRPPDDHDTFAYHSPIGFELYWDVELKEAHLPRIADMRIILTELRAIQPETFTVWLNKPAY